MSDDTPAEKQLDIDMMNQQQPVKPRAEQILDWALERDSFRAKEVSEFLGVSPQSVGGTLGTLVRSGELIKVGRDYKIPPPKNQFESNLRKQLEERLVVLAPAEDEAKKLRNALKILPQ